MVLRRSVIYSFLLWSILEQAVDVLAVPHQNGGKHPASPGKRHKGGADSEVLVLDTFQDAGGFWFAKASVGDSQDVTVLIDTGSADVMLNPGVYKPGEASVNTGRTVRLGFETTNPDGTGVLSGHGTLFDDTVSMGPFTAKRQTLVNITDPPNESVIPHDGIIGFSSSQSSVSGSPSFFQSLCNQNQVTQCRFGLVYRANGTGHMVFGGLEDSLYQGELNTIKLAGGDEWVLNMGITVNGRTFSQRGTTVIDGGTAPAIIGSSQYVTKLFAAAGVQSVAYPATAESGTGFVRGYYACDQPPNITFTASTANGIAKFPLSAEALFDSQAEGSNNCTISATGLDIITQNSFVILGQKFFHGRYLDFNFDDSTIGIATTG